jgi:hypothetical protein
MDRAKCFLVADCFTRNSRREPTRLAFTAVLIAAALGVTVGPAAAKCDVIGNCYTVTPSDNGGYRVQGVNLSTGSQWNSTIDERGSRGFDADGNYWTYDRRSWSYINYGTGRKCVGQRACAFDAEREISGRQRP